MCGGTKGLRRNVWTRTKILSPNICYFVAILRFVAIYAHFGRRWVKIVFLGQEPYQYMIYIEYYNELRLQLCNYAQKRRICRENSKDKIFVVIFAIGCQLRPPCCNIIVFLLHTLESDIICQNLVLTVIFFNMQCQKWSIHWTRNLGASPQHPNTE